MMAVCVIVVLWLGLYPQTFIRTAKPTIDSLQQLTNSGKVSVYENGGLTAASAGSQRIVPDQAAVSSAAPQAEAGR